MYVCTSMYLLKEICMYTYLVPLKNFFGKQNFFPKLIFGVFLPTNVLVFRLWQQLIHPLLTFCVLYYELMQHVILQPFVSKREHCVSGHLMRLRMVVDPVVAPRGGVRTVGVLLVVALTVGVLLVVALTVGVLLVVMAHQSF